MGIFDFFRKKTDVEEYLAERKKTKKIVEKNLISEINRQSSFIIEQNNEINSEINEVLRGSLSQIAKIKKIREIADISLKEAKELVNESTLVNRNGNVSVKDNFADILNADISKIEKIKKVREKSGLGLREAKEVVDKHEELSGKTKI